MQQQQQLKKAASRSSSGRIRRRSIFIERINRASVFRFSTSCVIGRPIAHLRTKYHSSSSVQFPGFCRSYVRFNVRSIACEARRSNLVIKLMQSRRLDQSSDPRSKILSSCGLNPSVPSDH
jgi:hypothetical protein